MQTSTDQTGRTIHFPDSPQRIVSLVPSQTELLHDLGLEEEVIGITKFCIHPAEWYRNKKRIGGTKQLDIELIRSLKPDLIIANKEENEQSQIEALSAHFPVWISDIQTFSGAKKMILEVGKITGHYFEAIGLLKKIDTAFDELASEVKKRIPQRAAYLIWNNPMMAAGNNTFINSMLEACGFVNAFHHLSRYPEITDAGLLEANPDYILLSSEPFPFNQKHQEEFTRRFPGTKILCVDGEMFSWYGSRLQYAPAYFLSLFEQIKAVD